MVCRTSRLLIGCGSLYRGIWVIGSLLREATLVLSVWVRLLRLVLLMLLRLIDGVHTELANDNPANSNV